MFEENRELVRLIESGEFYTNSPTKATCPKCLAKIEERKSAGKSIYSMSYRDIK